MSDDSPVPAGGKAVPEPVQGRLEQWLGTAVKLTQRAQLKFRDFLIADRFDAHVQREVGSLRDRDAVLGDDLEPAVRPLHEMSWRKDNRWPSAVHGPHDAPHQAHVMIRARILVHPILPGTIPICSCIARQLLIILCCDSITPLGSPVDPEEYCNNASPCSPGGKVGEWCRPLEEIIIQGIAIAPGWRFQESGRPVFPCSAASRREPMIMVGAQSAGLARNLAMAVRPVGGQAGTTVAPAAMPPNSAAT